MSSTLKNYVVFKISASGLFSHISALILSYSNERKKCSLSRMETFCLRIVKKKTFEQDFHISDLRPDNITS